MCVLNALLSFSLNLPLNKQHPKHINEKHRYGKKPHSDSTTIRGYNRTKDDKYDYHISQVIPPELGLNYLE